MLYSLSIESAISFCTPFLLAPTPSFISISFQRKHHERSPTTNEPPVHESQSVDRSRISSSLRTTEGGKGRQFSYQCPLSLPHKLFAASFLPSLPPSLSLSLFLPSFLPSFAALLLRGLDARARRISEYQWRCRPTSVTFNPRAKKIN